MQLPELYQKLHSAFGVDGALSHTYWRETACLQLCKLQQSILRCTSLFTSWWRNKTNLSNVLPSRRVLLDIEEYTPVDGRTSVWNQRVIEGSFYYIAGGRMVVEKKNAQVDCVRCIASVARQHSQNIRAAHINQRPFPPLRNHANQSSILSRRSTQCR